MSRRILFVDDERNVLEGLHRMFRVYRKEWDVRFALSGPDALAFMARENVDVIVADLRMPGMDGAELLAEVQNRHPDAIRIVLSGRSDQNLIMKSVGVTHQYLSKPCDAETLRSTILRAAALRDLLQDSNLRYLIAQMGQLPSIPAVYLELLRELQAPEVSIQRIGHIIARDPGMSAKLLQLANSAFFGRRRRVSNPEEATMYLGVERIQQLFLLIHAFSQFEVPANAWFSIERLWHHSLTTGLIARRIAEIEGSSKEMVEEAFTAGLLHDVGQLMLASRLPDRFRTAVEWSREYQISLCEAERETLGAAHAEIGACLLGLWGLPDTLVEAVAFHHTPRNLPSRSFGPLAMVHVADSWSHDAEQDPKGGGLDAVYLEGLGLRDRIDTWRSSCHEILQGMQAD